MIDGLFITMQLAQQPSVLSYMPGTQWELLAKFMLANKYTTYAAVMVR